MTNQQGWIKLHRQILEWEWYSDNNCFRLFLHLILKANHKEKRFKGIELKVGSIVTSRDLLARETGLSSQQIRTALSKLISTNEITSVTSSQGTIIQIVSYEKYQVSTNEITNEQQTSNQQSTTNKNDKNNKEILFNDFWKLYDKQVDRKKCLDKFLKLKDEEIKLIFENLPHYIRSTPDKQFRKNPATWINNKCWNDAEYSKPQTITYTPNIVHE
jgi:hypothetical protein